MLLHHREVPRMREKTYSLSKLAELLNRDRRTVGKALGDMATAQFERFRSSRKRKSRRINCHPKSKYPPAKPGALRSEPLKAAGRGRSRAPVAVDRSSTSPPIFSLPRRKMAELG